MASVSIGAVCFAQTSISLKMARINGRNK